MQRKLTITAYIAGFIGIALLIVNLVGLFMPLRASVIDKGYADFARGSTLEFQQAMQQLENLALPNNKKLLIEATKIFHYGMAHIPPEDVERDGFAYYRMRVPLWENYLLYLLSYIKPDTYQDYEFCSYRKALERGTGRCGQQSLALVGYLAERGLETGFVYLGGHTLAIAKTSDDQWFMLDPDYGGVIPHELNEVEASPDKVLSYYWNDQMRNREAYLLFSSEANRATYGGPEIRWGRVCVIEQATYVLKWLLPILLMLLWAVGMILLRKKH